MQRNELDEEGSATNCFLRYLACLASFTQLPTLVLSGVVDEVSALNGTPRPQLFLDSSLLSRLLLLNSSFIGFTDQLYI